MAFAHEAADFLENLNLQIEKCKEIFLKNTKRYTAGFTCRWYRRKLVETLNVKAALAKRQDGSPMGG